jgi:predicted permease
VIKRLFSFARRSRRDIAADVDAELRFHLETRAEELMAHGRSRVDAERQARREFGDLEDARRYMRRLETSTEQQLVRREYMGELIQDVHYALRRLKSAPAFAFAAILTLALGIGANAAIFSIVNGVVFRPLALPDSDRLYAVYSANRTADSLRAPVSAVDLDDWRAGRRLIEDLGGYFYGEGSTGIDLTNRGQPRRLSAVFITPGFFTTVGATVVHGRLPREEEQVRGGPDRVVVLTYGFWMREFGGAPDVVNTPVTLNGEPYQILGVLPSEFRFPTDQADVFVPFSTIPDSGIPRIRPVRVLSVVGRLRPGVSQASAQTEMDGIARSLAAQYPEDRAWDSTTLVPLHEVVTGQVRRGLLVLLGAVGCVLLIACANLASLQLARSIGRGREMGVRVALGARRSRLVRQLLTESLVISLLGAAAGLALAKLIVNGLLVIGASELPRVAEVQLDGAVLAFAVVLAVITAVLFGLGPALRAASTDIQSMLRQGVRTTEGRETHRMRLALVVAEVALAVILVVGAGLMARSFSALLRVDAGFNPDHLIAVQFTISPSRYPAAPGVPGAPPAYVTFYQQAIEEVRSLPGIVSAAAVKDPPLRGNGERNGFRLPDQPVPAGQDAPSATTIHVSDGYFATIGARMVEGREFTPQDNGSAPPVVVVNEAFQRRFFPGQRAAGKQLLAGRATPIQIIGVVNDIRQVSMSEPAQPTMYLHNLQNSRVKTTIVARTAGDPLASAAAIRDAVWSIDPLQPITAVFTFDDSVGRALARPRLLVALLASFGVIGLGLGAVGLYGLLAFLAHERRREIGVRLSLGAQPSDVLVMFLRRGVLLALAGVTIGLTGALLLSRSMTAVLYDVTPTDPVTFSVVTALLLGTAVLASWIPARRASRVDPAEVLRSE